MNKFSGNFVVRILAHRIFIVIFPFSGWAWAGARCGFTSSIILLLTAVLLVATRAAVTPIGFIGLVMIMIAAITFPIVAGLSRCTGSPLRYSGAFVLSVTVLAILLTALAHREKILGVNIFYIPSDSMEPALLVGDVVVVDSWRYRKNKPLPGEIAVFYFEKIHVTFVKRVVSGSGNSFDAAGDNTKNSLPRHRLKNIDNRHLRGRAEFVLFNIGSRSSRTLHVLNPIKPPT